MSATTGLHGVQVLPCPGNGRLVAVTTLDGLEGAGGGAGGDRGAGERAVVEQDLHLDGGVSSAV